MAVYSKDGTALASLYSKDGEPLNSAYDYAGNLVYSTKGLLSYSIFEPTNAPSGYVSSNSKSNRGDILNVSTAQFLALFYDGFLTNMPSGVAVTKSSIGKDQSNTYDIYEYDFCPANYKRLILLSGGMHSYELAASFGLANFIVNLYGDQSNDAFRWIRENVRVKVIPVVNPWGFNQNPKKYGDSIGVNPNRNFDYDGRWDAFPSYTPSQNEWNVKGDYPFSVAETINLAKWVEANWNADFWIDCHTDNGSNAYDLDVYSLSDSAVADQIDSAITKISSWFGAKYHVTPVVNHLLNSDGSIRQYWCEFVAGVPTFTLEHCPRRTTFGTAAQNSAADIANYCTNLSTFVQEFILQDYVDDTVIAIASATNPQNVTIDASVARSRMITAQIAPANTTQNKFLWTSSDESVCAVYGGTNNAIIVGLANGSATLIGVNRFNSNIVVSCTVTVDGNA